MEINKCYCMDNLELMQQINDNSIDLIYSDILYGTGKKFKDYQDLKADKEAIYEFYIPRIKEMYRILKPTGSIYLQMDNRINHWVRCILDDIFGYKNFRNELVWCYRTQGFNKNKYSAKHDNILFYTKTDKWTFNGESIREVPSESLIKRFQPEIDRNGYFVDYKTQKKHYELIGSPPLDWFIVNVLQHNEPERVGYDTQKPLQIMNRIIKASSNEGDVLADFFMGSGSFLKEAKTLNRQYIGCDINPKALEITNLRLTS